MESMRYASFLCLSHSSLMIFGAVGDLLLLPPIYLRHNHFIFQWLGGLHLRVLIGHGDGSCHYHQFLPGLQHLCVELVGIRLRPRRTCPHPVLRGCLRGHLTWLDLDAILWSQPIPVALAVLLVRPGVLLHCRLHSALLDAIRKGLVSRGRRYHSQSGTPKRPES